MFLKYHRIALIIAGLLAFLGIVTLALDLYVLALWLTGAAQIVAVGLIISGLWALHVIKHKNGMGK